MTPSTPITITVPALSCRACDGDGRRWTGTTFAADACPRCGGTGAEAVTRRYTLPVRP